MLGDGTGTSCTCTTCATGIFANSALSRWISATIAVSVAVTTGAGDAGEEPFQTFTETIRKARAIGERKLVGLLRQGKIRAAGPCFLLKASYGYRDSEPVQIIQQPTGPAEGSPEWQALLVEKLAANPDLLQRALARAKEKK